MMKAMKVLRQKNQKRGEILPSCCFIVENSWCPLPTKFLKLLGETPVLGPLYKKKIFTRKHTIQK